MQTAILEEEILTVQIMHPEQSSVHDVDLYGVPNVLPQKSSAQTPNPDTVELNVFVPSLPRI